MANQYRSVLASSGPAPTGGDALPAEVLSGKTFTNDNGAQIGTMPNRGAVSQTLSAGQSYTIPAGYHNGEGVVTDNTVLNPASELITKNENALKTYTISGTDIEYVHASGASTAYTDGVMSAGLYTVDVHVPSNYRSASSGNVHCSSLSSTQVVIVMQGGGCTNAQFFIVGNNITITTN